MKARRGSSLWESDMAPMLASFRPGDVVFPVIVGTDFFGTVVKVNSKTNKVSVAWGGAGNIRQHDPGEIQHAPYTPNVAYDRMASRRVAKDDDDNPPMDTYMGDPEMHGLDEPRGGGFSIMQNLQDDLHKESLEEAKVATLRSRRGGVWDKVKDVADKVWHGPAFDPEHPDTSLDSPVKKRWQTGPQGGRYWVSESGKKHYAMSERLATELVRLARDVMSMEFDTQEQMDKYLKEHPGADKSRHRVKQQEKGRKTEKSKAGPKPKANLDDIKPGPQADFIKGTRNHFTKATGRQVPEILPLKAKMDKWERKEGGDLTEPVLDSVGKGYLKMDSGSIAKGAQEIVLNGKFSVEDVDAMLAWGEAKAKARLELTKQGVRYWDNGEKLTDEQKSYETKHAGQLVKEWGQSRKKFKKLIVESLTAPKDISIGGSKFKWQELASNRSDIYDAVGSEMKKALGVDSWHQAMGKSQGLDKAWNSFMFLLDEVKSLGKEADDGDVRFKPLAKILGNVIEDVRSETGKLKSKKTPKESAKVTFRSKAKVAPLLKKHGLKGDEDELKEVASYKRTTGGKKVSPQQLKAKFIQKMDASNYSSPEAFKKAKERIRKMDAKDFGSIFAAINEEEE